MMSSFKSFNLKFLLTNQSYVLHVGIGQSAKNKPTYYNQSYRSKEVIEVTPEQLRVGYVKEEVNVNDFSTHVLAQLVSVAT
ncbi:hypothetical protein Trydic_g1220 [Trypoxylus dichotomus]